MKAFLVAIISLAFLGGCGGGGSPSSSLPDGNGSTTVSLNGTYSLLGFVCYSDSSLTTQTAEGTVNASPSHSFVVSGNNYTTTWNNGSCTTTVSGQVFFNQTKQDASGTAGSYTLYGGSVSNTGSCSYNVTWNLAPGSPAVTPGSLSKTFTNGSTTSLNSGAYVNLFSGYLINEAPEISVVGYPSDICLWVYDKQ
jgi:hypothetical protein